MELKKQIKGLVAFCTVMTFMLTSVCGIYAAPKGKGQPKSPPKQHQNANFKGKEFKDVGNGHWAYYAINDLCNRGIIIGYDDNSFKPNELVTRSQFAAMLTKTLGLTTKSTTQTFEDVPVTNWDYKAVEAAKTYLTGYKAKDGDMYFNGSTSAVREDMAVALVNALELPLVSDDDELEKAFRDYESISKNLRDFVYTAYVEEVMIGSKGKFNPQGCLTRAEAAALLAKAIEKMEKVVVDNENDDDKVPVDDEDSDATLSDLEYDGKNVEDFDEDKIYYTVELEDDDDIPTVTAKPSDSDAEITITQATDIPGSAKIIVTAEDGTKKAYKINFVVED